jgi:SAM-dependent methyltransferase
MSLLVPPRQPSREILDDPGIPPEEMERSLADLWLVNRAWGGSRAIERKILRHSRPGNARRLVLLDIGAGSGHVSRRLARRLRAAGLEAIVIASDLQWRHLAAGRRMMDGEPPPAVCADAFALPFRDGAVDWVVSTLMLHHFSPEENASLLTRLAKVARAGLALLDLRRHLLPLAFVSAAGRLLFRTRISVDDGKASVRQAYTPEEVGAFTARALPGARVEKVFPFRLLVFRRAQ